MVGPRVIVFRDAAGHGIAQDAASPRATASPDLFIPHLVELYLQGRFPFDKLIKVYPLEQINEAAHDSEKDLTVKPVIRFG